MGTDRLARAAQGRGWSAEPPAGEHWNRQDLESYF